MSAERATFAPPTIRLPVASPDSALCCRLDEIAVPKVLKVFAERVEELGIVVNDEDPDPLVGH